MQVNELTRNIVADWIPILESNCFKYDIDIPETEFTINIDIHAYARIINNLFQNIDDTGISMNVNIYSKF